MNSKHIQQQQQYQQYQAEQNQLQSVPVTAAIDLGTQKKITSIE